MGSILAGFAQLFRKPVCFSFSPSAGHLLNKNFSTGACPYLNPHRKASFKKAPVHDVGDNGNDKYQVVTKGAVESCLGEAGIGITVILKPW